MLLRRVVLVLSAGVVLAAWGIAARTYAVDGSGDYSSVFGILIFAAGALTIGAAMLVVRAWRTRLRPWWAALVSALAAFSILVLAVAINLRG